MIEDLIGMSPIAPPPVTEDLATLRDEASRITVSGATRNIERLAALPIEALWLTEVREPVFNRIISMAEPLFLLVDTLRFADLSAIGRLRRLQALEIRNNTKVEDISFVRDLTQLRLFSLYHTPKVRDLGPISSLTNLEILDLAGGMWSSFRPQTLEPLARLAKLRGLSLKSIHVEDQSLEAVAQLRQLRELELSNQFPTEEYARLSVALPETQCTHFEPYVDLGGAAGAGAVMVTGKGKPTLTLPKDQARLEAYVRRFEALRDEFRELY